jgi:peptide deformylase
MEVEVSSEARMTADSGKYSPIFDKELVKPVMAVQPIRIYGDPCLKRVSDPVEEFGDALRELIADMTDTLYHRPHHVGLAAPQIGVNQRVFVMDVDWVESDPRKKSNTPPRRNLQVFINPEILEESAEDENGPEGCLSLPGIDGEIYRPLKVRVRYRDVQGNEHEISASDFAARCIQHENDHLNGVLFIDHLPLLRRQLLAGKLSRLKKMQQAGEAPASD